MEDKPPINLELTQIFRKKTCNTTLFYTFEQPSQLVLCGSTFCLNDSSPLCFCFFLKKKKGSDSLKLQGQVLFMALFGSFNKFLMGLRTALWSCFGWLSHCLYFQLSDGQQKVLCKSILVFGTINFPISVEKLKSAKEKNNATPVILHCQPLLPRVLLCYWLCSKCIF